MKKKDYAKMAGAIALTAAIAVSGTWAYLSKITQPKTNVFTSEKDIETKLEEDFEETEAGKYTPGQVIHKNPYMYNNSTDLDIYVAMKLEFFDNNGNQVSLQKFTDDYADIMKEVTGEEGKSNLVKALIGDNLTDWESIHTANTTTDKSEMYMLTTPLAPGTNTGPTTDKNPNGINKPLFTDTQVKTGIHEVIKEKYESAKLFEKNEKGEWTLISNTDSSNSSKVISQCSVDNNNAVIEDTCEEVDAYELPKFKIVVTGYAVQATDEIDYNTAKTELVRLAGYDETIVK